MKTKELEVVCCGYIKSDGTRHHCDKIKKDGVWVKGKRTQSKVSHGLCSDCQKELERQIKEYS